MGTINSIKQQPEADTPLLFFQCVLASGSAQYWCSHSIVFNGTVYSARVLKHNLFDLTLSADDAVDGISQLSLTLANADSLMSELNAPPLGLKGAQLTVYFAFADLSTLTVTTESTILFRGLAGNPDEVTEEYLNLTFTNKLALQRIPLPEVRIQRSCPWNFPASAPQRSEALSGGASGRFSRYYRCGYSADMTTTGGVGSLNAGQPYTSCDKTRANCQARGMFDTDSTNNITRRFGGLEFVPSGILVRTAGDKTSHLSPLVDNSAKYNDPVPLVYGTGWLRSPVVFARNDGNLTHIETLLGMGVIDNIFKVVVNNVEIPLAVSGQDMSATGWYTPVSNGSRAGVFNADFVDSSSNPLGDPHGSLASLSVVVPNRIASGSAVPNVEVLMAGLQVDTFKADGTPAGTQPVYSNNPAWVILDILRRCGWSTSELDLTAFANSAAFCATTILTTDLNGNTIQVPRYECNLIVTKRQSAAAIVRGIRVASSLMLRYGTSGLLELMPETTVLGQQSALPDGGNSTIALDGGGWPVYEFSDSTGPFSGIIRSAAGASTLRLTSNSVAQTANRLSVEFQDELNEYQQDSLSVIDSDDVALIGYENSSQSIALGIASFSQANRVLLRQLDKSTNGNTYVQFQTSFRALKVRPGDIITITYLKEGFSRTPFRVVKLSPSLNYEIVTVLAQIHDDDWYSDNPAILAGAGRQPSAATGTPRPLIGLTPHPLTGVLEFFDFEITENLQALADGTATDTLSVNFSLPTKPAANATSLPLLSLSPGYSTPGGSLPDGGTFYYAVSAVDATGLEGCLSFTVQAVIPTGGVNTNYVTISGLSLPPNAVSFNVYRGTTPQVLYRIASSVPLNPDSNFTDDGSSALRPIGPPDASFDHANFYYRYQYGGPFPVTTSLVTGVTIGWSDLGAVGVNYMGRVARIMEGQGRGQERSIVSNTATTLTVTPAWSVRPDSTSIFTIVQSAWTFAAVSATSPAQFEIAYQAGAVIQISGRGANVNNQEGSPDLCPLTTWTLGVSQTDAGLPGVPQFQLATQGGGELTLSQLRFASLANTVSITSGTLQVFHWSEVTPPSGVALATDIDVAGGTLQLQVSQPFSAYVGLVFQIGNELVSVIDIGPAPNTYQVARNALASFASAHAAGAAVLPLDNSTIMVTFANGYFDNRASSNYLHTESLPDVRVVAASFSVTNAFGNSVLSPASYTQLNGDQLLRTLSGGQFSLQVSGYLATQQNAAPPLLVQASHAVRDMRASLNQAAGGFDVAITILQNGVLYQALTIPSGATVSQIVSGAGLAALQDEDTLTLNIVLNPSATTSTAPTPGRDLTVTIRF